MTFSVELTTIISMTVFVVLWLGRIQYLALTNQERIKELVERVLRIEEKHDELDSRIMDKLSFIERSLAKIEGRLISEKENSK